MQLADIFNRLSLGVLSNLAIGNDGSGEVATKWHPKLTMHVGNSLASLYARFNLLEREMVIRADETISMYLFAKQFANTNAGTGVKYIMDHAENIFTEDVFKILAIYDELGEEFVINDPDVPASLYTPNSASLLIPTPVSGAIYRILYQAKHPSLMNEAGVNLYQPILLPEILVPALEAHVAFQVISPMNGAEHAAKAIEHLGRYEMLCLEAETKDQVSTSLVQTHNKLDDRGFL